MRVSTRANLLQELHRTVLWQVNEERICQHLLVGGGGGCDAVWLAESASRITADDDTRTFFVNGNQLLERDISAMCIHILWKINSMTQSRQITGPHDRALS